MNKTIKIENPCYRCYACAIEECNLTNCKYKWWNDHGDVERQFLEIDFNEVKQETADYIKELIDYRNSMLF